MKQPLLPYATIRRFERNPLLFVEVVPVEHTISLPLPTRRWSHSAYATFASPALFSPDQPVRQAPPDCWWVVDAISSKLLLLAEWEVLPFADGTWESVTLPSIRRSIEQQQEDLIHFEACMDQVAPAFFAQSSDESGREEMRQMLAFMLPDILLPQYHALVPDFFAWLHQVR